MARYTVECACGCGSFESGSSRAKWKTPGCKKRSQRQAAGSSNSRGTGSVVDAAGAGAEHEPTAETVYGRDVLEAVRCELEKAGCLDTVDGRVAMYLARKSIDPDAKNPAAMFKEMRQALATALEAAAALAAPTAVAAEPEPDEVTKARKRRDQKARQASTR